MKIINTFQVHQQAGVIVPKKYVESTVKEFNADEKNLVERDSW